MNKLIGVIKIIMLIILVVVGLVAGVFAGLLPGKWQQTLTGWGHYGVTKIVGVTCHFTGAKFSPGSLLVGNHISWLDIPVIGSKYPVLFLSKSEVASWPVLGYLAKKAGTLFIKRGEGAAGAIREIAKTLDGQQTVAIFPEGKTTDGLDIIRFQPRLFQAAIDSNQPVQPLAIRYTNNQGAHTTHVSYYGETGFMESLWRVVCGGRFDAQIHLFDPIGGVNNRDRLSQQAEALIKKQITT